MATVAVSPPSGEIIAGTTLVLTATTRDAAGGTLQGRTITWSSGNTAVATVSQSGTVTGVAAGGPVAITATSEGRSGSAQITVLPIPVATVTVTPTTATLVPTATTTLTASIRDAGGATLTGRPVVWSSSAESIATVSQAGVVTAVAIGGPVTITATSEGKSGSAQITVIPVPVASVTVTPATASLVPTATTTLTANILDAGGATLTGRPVVWSSSAQAIATVSQAGVVTAVAIGGPVTITATSEGKSGSAQITVIPVPVGSVEVSPGAATLVPGATAPLTATVKDADGGVLAGRPITWTSSATATATVSQTGVVTAVAVGGPVTITATSEGKSGSAQITVVAGTQVGAAGGVVTAGGGNLTLTVPAGALATPVIITTAPVTSPQPNPKLVPGTAWDFGPTGTQFSTPVTMTIKYEAGLPGGLVPGGFRLHRWSGSAWLMVAGSTTDPAARTVTGQISSFSRYAVLEVSLPVAVVSVSPPSGSVMIGGTTVLTVTLKDGDGVTLTDRPVTWTSGSPSVATVSNTGVVTGVAVGGPVNITATSEGVTGSAQVTVVPKDLAAIVETFRAQHGLPAMGGAIVTRDGIWAIGVSGNRRFGMNLPVTINDKWHIGSNLKGITGALAALAVQEGKISWTTTVAQAYPEKAGQIHAGFQNATLRDLLAMRAGFPAVMPPPQGTTARQQRDYFVTQVLAQAPSGPFGTYLYSNASYVVAGSMIERAMQGNYEDLIENRLGVPSGANGIGWGPQAAPGSTNQPVAHGLVNGVWTPCEGCDNVPGLSAAGRSHMPLGDWAKITVQLLKGYAGQPAILNPAELLTVFTGITAIPNSTVLYGLGWQMTTRPWGGRTAFHAGSNTINHSITWVGLDTGVAFLVVTNAADLQGGITGAALNALITRLITLWQTGQ